MIGVRRPSQSLPIQQFKGDGLITSSRGRVTIADRKGLLLARACGCIRIIHAEEARLRATTERYDIGVSGRIGRKVSSGQAKILAGRVN